MDLNPSVSWDLPLSLTEALTLAASVWVALIAGLLLRRARSRLFRVVGSGIVGLDCLAAFFVCFSVQRFGIEWPGQDVEFVIRWGFLKSVFVGAWLAIYLITAACLRRRTQKADGSR